MMSPSCAPYEGFIFIIKVGGFDRGFYFLTKSYTEHHN